MTEIKRGAVFIVCCTRARNASVHKMCHAGSISTHCVAMVPVVVIEMPVSVESCACFKHMKLVKLGRQPSSRSQVHLPSCARNSRCGKLLPTNHGMRPSLSATSAYAEVQLKLLLQKCMLRPKHQSRGACPASLQGEPVRCAAAVPLAALLICPEADPLCL